MTKKLLFVLLIVSCGDAGNDVANRQKDLQFQISKAESKRISFSSAANNAAFTKDSTSGSADHEKYKTFLDSMYYYQNVKSFLQHEYDSLQAVAGK